MDNVKELKDIIFKLKMKLIIKDVPVGCCPYTYYPAKRTVDCNIGCEECRKLFFQDIKKIVRKEVDKL